MLETNSDLGASLLELWNLTFRVTEDSQQRCGNAPTAQTLTVSLTSCTAQPTTSWGRGRTWQATRISWLTIDKFWICATMTQPSYSSLCVPLLEVRKIKLHQLPHLPWTPPNKTYKHYHLGHRISNTFKISNSYGLPWTPSWSQDISCFHNLQLLWTLMDSTLSKSRSWFRL